MAVIAAYAAAHRLTIVRTYIDEGISGLRINNRLGLIGLISDVQSGAADFGNVRCGTSVAGGGFRTQTRAHITNSSASSLV
ncbi:hypothetical protein N2603_36250 [Bradyrhizobium huanghuaihaiense]|nr:hypothetical protein N2603_36250 [Bradyrhizobium sp. CB3035]